MLAQTLVQDLCSLAQGLEAGPELAVRYQPRRRRRGSLRDHFFFTKPCRFVMQSPRHREIVYEVGCNLKSAAECCHIRARKEQLITSLTFLVSLVWAHWHAQVLRLRGVDRTVLFPLAHMLLGANHVAPLHLSKLERALICR